MLDKLVAQGGISRDEDPLRISVYAEQSQLLQAAAKTRK